MQKVYRRSGESLGPVLKNGQVDGDTVAEASIYMILQFKHHGHLYSGSCIQFITVPVILW